MPPWLRPDKRRYRRFRIHSVTNDDPHAMAEVIRRRYTRLMADIAKNGGRYPDLILCDGAQLQVEAARMVLRELKLNERIPVAGLNEHFEEIVVGEGRPNIILSRDNKALHILMRLRDEAHRFAIIFNRSLRLRALKASVLDELPGIGARRKQQLLVKFGSVHRIAIADISEIASLPGITQEMAQDIKEALSARVLNPE